MFKFLFPSSSFSFFFIIFFFLVLFIQCLQFLSFFLLFTSISSYSMFISISISAKRKHIHTRLICLLTLFFFFFCSTFFFLFHFSSSVNKIDNRHSTPKLTEMKKQTKMCKYCFHVPTKFCFFFFLLLIN